MQLDIVVQNLFIPSVLCTRLVSSLCRLSPYPMHDSVLVLQGTWLGLNLVSDEPLDSSWVYYHDLWHVMHLFKYLHGCKVLTRHTHTHACTLAHTHTCTHTHNHTYTHTFINTNHKDCKVGEVGTVAGHNTSIHVCCHTTICCPIFMCLMHDESG